MISVQPREKPAEPRLVDRLSRIGRTVFLTFFVLASLLTFPNAIPWMVACWLLWHTLLVSRNRPGWLPLAACAAILFVKRVDWSPGLIATAMLLLTLCVLWVFAARKPPPPWSKRLAWLGTLGVWIAWASMTYGWYASVHAQRRLAVQPTRPVVCIGDSLTAFGYPQRLQEMISLPVVDLSCNGITTGDAIRTLPPLVKVNPQVVVIELGGHDYLRGRSRAATRDNLEKIVDACRSIGATVVLMEIPRGFITDPFSGLEREMARQRSLELIPDTAIRRLVLWSPCAPPGMWLKPQSHLSNDGLHPNRQGNRMLAEYVADALARIYGSGVRAGRVGFGQKNQSPGWVPQLIVTTKAI
jgi:lysophospholipase L1-like esterase